ncbi:hypothetical protein SCORR_v1c00640 [Spiroplasma corruscae]|uniref:Probable cell division protein WhiA n=1 Tax=Spiroplasma corruscae TaxID=216934 RepID=A0A222EMW2_9MOLU|nr:DNA-binding protein WhiA [Spiroplasma corruscae]ASP27839.1 hypothetical protein SCORR_v1c00640 [Spiroplasma corruscae]
MSFALKVKEEILNHNFTEKQMRMILLGFLKFNGELIYNDNEVLFQLSSSSNKIIRGVFNLLKNFYQEDFQTTVIDLPVNVSNKKLYRILISKNVKNFLESFEVYNFNDNKKVVKVKEFEINNTFEKHQDLVRAYVSGLFIAIGSVNSPETSNYHLELQFKSEEESSYFVGLMNQYNFDFKIVQRRNNSVAYIKKSMLVSDFLKFIDASESVMAFENTRIDRDLKNNVNRYLNIEIHNQKNTIIAGSRQVKEIEFIKKQGLFGKLPIKAQKLAQARLKNPDASFSDLVQILEENNLKISKSGVSNLFKIISNIFNQIKKG